MHTGTMLAEAIKSDGVEEIYKLGEAATARDCGSAGNAGSISIEGEIDIFDDDYMDRIDKIKLPNTKLQLLQKLLKKALDEFNKTNKTKGIDFIQRFQSLVDKYNERNP